jgi:hypothetical protein
MKLLPQLAALHLRWNQALQSRSRLGEIGDFVVKPTPAPSADKLKQYEEQLARLK